MRARPFSIIAITLILLFTPAILVLSSLLRANGDWVRAWESTTPFAALLTLIAPAVAYGVWRVRAAGYYSFIAYSVLCLSYQFYVYFLNPEAALYVTLLMSALFAAGGGYFLQRHVSAPYFNPNLRWWERDPRYRIQLQARFEIDRMNQKGSLLDISRGGCFAELDSILFPGDMVELRLTIERFDITSRAKVIWRSSDPRGYGLMFFGLTHKQKKELHRLIDHLSAAPQVVVDEPISAASGGL